jgi:hypothetical protein
MTKEEFNEKWRNIVIQVDGPIDISIVEAINWITRAKVFYDSKKCRRPKPIEIAKDFLSIEDTEIITKESWMNKYYSGFCIDMPMCESFRSLNITLDEIAVEFDCENVISNMNLTESKRVTGNVFVSDKSVKEDVNLSYPYPTIPLIDFIMDLKKMYRWQYIYNWFNDGKNFKVIVYSAFLFEDEEVTPSNHCNDIFVSKDQKRLFYIKNNNDVKTVFCVYDVVGESFRCTDLSQKYKQIVRKQVFNYKGMLYIQLIDNLYIAKDKSEIIELNTVDTILNIYNSIEKRTENNDSVVEEITK